MINDAIYEQRIWTALKALSSNPSTTNAIHLAECYIDAAECYAVARRWDDCYDCIKCAELLSYNSETIVTKIINVCFRCKNIIESSEIVDALFDLVVNVDFENNANLRKQVFEAFHWFSRFWSAYLDFCDWWGFENFDITDFQMADKRDSLAESAYIAYSRRLAFQSVAEYMFDFYADFADKMLRHNFTVYADYHIVSFMLRVGFGVQDVLRGFRRYIKQKFLKPWSWMRLANLFEEGSIEYQACEMFAAECEGNPLSQNPTNLDYKTVCHNLFADQEDPDAEFWMHMRAKLLEMKTLGKWQIRDKRKDNPNAKSTPI